MLPVENPIPLNAPALGVTMSLDRTGPSLGELPISQTTPLKFPSQLSDNIAIDAENNHMSMQTSSAGPSSLAIIEPVVSEETMPATERLKELSPPTQLDDMPVPLFLPSREASSSPEVEQAQLPPSPDEVEEYETVPGPTPGLRVYVEMPPLPWRRRQLKRESGLKGKAKEIVKTREQYGKDVHESRSKESAKEKSWSALQGFKKNVEEQAVPLSIPEMLSLAHPKAVPSETKKLDISGMYQ